jgi:hypothetical protein
MYSFLDDLAIPSELLSLAAERLNPISRQFNLEFGGARMRQDLTEDEMDELNVVALLELLQRFGDPLKRPAKVIPWPTPSDEGLNKARVVLEANAAEV